MSISESSLQRLIVRCCKRNGILCYKWSSPSHRGVPDLIVVYPGGGINFIELKTDDGKLTKLQEREIALLRKSGATVSVLKGHKEVRLWCEYIEKCIPSGILS